MTGSEENWQMCHLEEVCDLITDGAHASPKEELTGLPMASVKDLTRHGLIIQGCKRISPQDYATLIRSGCKPVKGDVLIAKDGATCLDTVCVFSQDDDVVLLSSIAILRPGNKLLPSFLRYYLESPKVKRMLKTGFVSGSAIPRVILKDFKRAPITIPTLEEQHRIVNILEALDNKIELNRQMNQTIEAIVRAIFKSWFINFDPVRAKMEGHKPFGMDEETAALFPNLFEDSELGEIPKGWEVSRLADICTTQYGYTASSKKEKVGPHLLRVMDINKTDWINWIDVPYCQIDEQQYDNYRLVPGDIVVARMADPGKSAIIDEEIDAVFASYLVRLKIAKLELILYVYYFLKSPIYSDYTTSVKSGSVQPNMNAKVITGIPILLPPVEITKKFDDVVRPLRNTIVHYNHEAIILQQLRDLLLPKLISGEIHIKPQEEVRKV